MIRLSDDRMIRGIGFVVHIELFFRHSIFLHGLSDHLIIRSSPHEVRP